MVFNGRGGGDVLGESYEPRVRSGPWNGGRGLGAIVISGQGAFYSGLTPATRGSRLNSGLTPRAIRCRRFRALEVRRCRSLVGSSGSRLQLGAHAPSYTMSPFSGSSYEAVSVFGRFYGLTPATRGSRPSYMMSPFLGSRQNPMPAHRSNQDIISEPRLSEKP